MCLFCSKHGMVFSILRNLCITHYWMLHRTEVLHFSFYQTTSQIRCQFTVSAQSLSELQLKIKQNIKHSWISSSVITAFIWNLRENRWFIFDNQNSCIYLHLLRHSISIVAVSFSKIQFMTDKSKLKKLHFVLLFSLFQMIF